MGIQSVLFVFFSIKAEGNNEREEIKDMSNPIIISISLDVAVRNHCFTCIIGFWIQTRRLYAGIFVSNEINIDFR